MSQPTTGREYAAQIALFIFAWYVITKLIVFIASLI